MKFIDYPSKNYDISDRAIRAVVLHGTAGTAGSALAELTALKPGNPGARVSSNFLVTRAGVIYRLVDFEKGRRAWANGIVETWDKSLDWLAYCVANKINPNEVTVSIEHEASDAAMKSRASMTDRQFNASIELTAYILRAAGLKASHETIIGHNQISGSRKSYCPGVIFPPAYTEVLIDRNRDLEP